MNLKHLFRQVGMLKETVLKQLSLDKFASNVELQQESDNSRQFSSDLFLELIKVDLFLIYRTQKHNQPKTTQGRAEKLIFLASDQKRSTYFSSKLMRDLDPALKTPGGDFSTGTKSVDKSRPLHFSAAETSPVEATGKESPG